jgi:MipA family protein
MRNRLHSGGTMIVAAAALALPVAAPSAARAQGQAPAPTGQGDERRPLFELGVAGGGAWRPDYPASDQSRVGGVAAPFLILRSELLRSDASGVRGRVFRSEWGELNLSLTGAFPSRSEGNEAREGMPDLDWMGEVGPALRLNLWRDPARARRVTLELPVRAAFTADLAPVSIRYRGLVFAPELAYERRGLFARGSRLRVGIGPIFGTERFHDYFYEVDPEFARPGRRAYDAKGGYLGTRLQLSYRVPLTGRLSAVVGGRAEGFWGAANSDSPLFRRETNFTVAAGFSWSLYRSEATVAAASEPFD